MQTLAQSLWQPTCSSTRRSYAVNDAPMATLKGKSKPVPVVTLGEPLEPRRQQNSEDVFTAGTPRWPFSEVLLIS